VCDVRRSSRVAPHGRHARPSVFLALALFLFWPSLCGPLLSAFALSVSPWHSLLSALALSVCRCAERRGAHRSRPMKGVIPLISLCHCSHIALSLLSSAASRLSHRAVIPLIGLCHSSHRPPLASHQPPPAVAPLICHSVFFLQPSHRVSTSTTYILLRDLLQLRFWYFFHPSHRPALPMLLAHRLSLRCYVLVV
jgi:hypothetical protein